MSLATWFRDAFREGEGQIGMDSATPERKPKPRLVVVHHAPSPDEFAAWRADPTTQFVFAAMRSAQAEQKAAWEELSWGAGNADERELIMLRTRADAYAAIEEVGYEALCEWAGIDPEPQPERDGNGQ
jgi:hypothetical protein